MIYAALTDVGIKRNNNEDSYIVNTEGKDKLFIVADGMGGHNAGEVASLEACRIIESHVMNTEGNIEDVLKTAVEKANRDLFIRASENEGMRGMGTTIDALVATDDCIYVAHVGDSRVYVITDGDMRKITKDHSIVGMMVDSGSITEEEAKIHPQRNLITRAVGTAMTVDVDIVKEEIHTRQWILMCTDGLTNMVAKDEIHSIFKECEDADAIAKTLVEKAKQNGGDDNITVVVIKMKKGGGR